VLAGALVLPLLSSCAQRCAEAEATIFAMDTVMSLTVYGEDGERVQTALDSAVERIYALDQALSSADEDSPIYALNTSGAEDLTPETAQLLADALELCRTTGGALDITAYPAVKAWGFISGDHRVPDQEELDALAAAIGYDRVELDEERAALPQGTELDLGAVAKGYAGDQLALQLREDGISSALLDLGQSTILAMGAKPDGSPWRVAIQDPAGEGYLGVLELTDQAVGTSGGYQRYFEEDGVRYWHLIDPATAAPARSGLSSVTVVGPSAFICDGLSTALFVMGLEEGASFWREHRAELEFDVVFVTQEGEVCATAGLTDRLALTGSYEGREVTVLDE